MPIKSPYPNLPEQPELNVHHAILRRPNQSEWSNFPVHIDAETGKARGFKDFVERVKWAATALGAPVGQGGLELSAENGDVIGIMSENSMDYITFAHACFYITTPLALISSFSKPFELRHALDVSKANCLFIDEAFLSTALPIAGEVGIPSERIFVMKGSAPGRKSFSQLIDEARTQNLEIVGVRPARKDTLAYLVFSSGTTGLPKAVMISHGNIWNKIAQNEIVGESVQKDITLMTPDQVPKILAFLPFHHSYGLVTFSIFSLLIPRTTIIMPKWNIDWALSLIPKYRVSLLPLVPSMVHQLVHYPKTARTDLSSVMNLSCGGAYLPQGLGEKLTSFSNQGSCLLEGYGMSESTLGMMVPPSRNSMGDHIKPKSGSPGFLAPGMEARILREDGTEADANEVGELWVKGPTIGLGYQDNEKATKETFVNGWLRTGDKFRIDEDGFFFFVDRAKDTLKVSGSQVSPIEIENVLLAHPKKLIQDVAVAGVVGGRTSDERVPRAWVILSKEGKKLGATVVAKELDTWHRQNLSKYKWLRGGIEVTEEIPKSPTGKVLRRVLKDNYEQHL